MTADRHPDTDQIPRCVLDRGRPQPTTLGHACAHHVELLAEMLDPAQRGQMFVSPGARRVVASIPVLYAWLPVERRVGHRTGPVGVFGPRSPGDDTAIVHRDDRSGTEDGGPWPVRGTLAAVALRLGLPNGGTVVELAAALHAHLEALCGSEWIADAWGDLDTLHRQLRRAVGDSAPRSVGPCPECGAALYVPERPPRGDDEPVVLRRLRCGHCHTSHDPADVVAATIEAGAA